MPLTGLWFRKLGPIPMVVTGTHDPYSRRTVHSRRLRRVVHRPRSRRARGGRPRTCAARMAVGGRDHDGKRNMVDALRRHARFHHADTDVLRHTLDHPFPRGGDRRNQCRLLRHQSPECIAGSPRSQWHLHGTWHCRHALHRHGGNAGARGAELRPPLRFALPGHSDRRVDGGTMAGIPHHGSSAQTRCRCRHGPGHLRDALHGDASGHLYRPRPGSQRPRTRNARSNSSRAGSCRHHVCRSGLRVDRLPVRAEARRRGAASGLGGSRTRQPGDHHGRARLPPWRTK